MTRDPNTQCVCCSISRWSNLCLKEGLRLGWGGGLILTAQLQCYKYLVKAGSYFPGSLACHDDNGGLYDGTRASAWSTWTN